MNFCDTASDRCLSPRPCVGRRDRAFPGPPHTGRQGPLHSAPPRQTLLPLVLSGCHALSPCAAEEAGAARGGRDVRASGRWDVGALTSLHCAVLTVPGGQGAAVLVLLCMDRTQDHALEFTRYANCVLTNVLKYFLPCRIKDPKLMGSFELFQWGGNKV